MNDVIKIIGEDQKNIKCEELLTYNITPSKNNLHKKLAILYDGEIKLIESCKVCKIYPPPRSHHCSICNTYFKFILFNYFFLDVL